MMKIIAEILEDTGSSHGALLMQQNTHAEVRFQKCCFATLLKSHFGMVVLM